VVDALQGQRFEVKQLLAIDCPGRSFRQHDIFGATETDHVSDPMLAQVIDISVRQPTEVHDSAGQLPGQSAHVERGDASA
jgi:hypothetical protein